MRGEIVRHYNIVGQGEVWFFAGHETATDNPAGALAYLMFLFRPGRAGA